MRVVSDVLSIGCCIAQNGVEYMRLFRWLVSFPVAVIVTSGLFLLMYHLIRQEELPPLLPSKDPVELPKVEREPEKEIEIIDPPVKLPPPPKPPVIDPPTPGGRDVIDVIPPKPPIGPGREEVVVGGLYPILILPPAYPARCEGRGIEGQVVVIYDVTYGGAVVNARILSSTDECFNKAVLRAVAKWKYSPGLGDSGAIRATGLQQVISFEQQDATK